MFEIEIMNKSANAAIYTNRFVQIDLKIIFESCCR